MKTLYTAKLLNTKHQNGAVLQSWISFLQIHLHVQRDINKFLAFLMVYMESAEMMTCIPWANAIFPSKILHINPLSIQSYLLNFMER